MRLYFAAFLLYTLGLLIAALMAEYTLYGWQEAFWIWDKSITLVLFLVISRPPKRTPGIGILISFAVSRLIVEFFIIITGWKINEIRLIRVLFMLYLLICLIALLKELREWQRSR